MTYKAIFCDLDGTLIEPGVFPVPPATPRLKRVLSLYRKKGIRFIITTARTLKGCGNLPSELKTPFLILENGAKIYDLVNKRYIKEYYIDPKTAAGILKFFRNEKTGHLIVHDNGRRLTDPNQVKDWKISKITLLDFDHHLSNRVWQQLRNKDLHIDRSIHKANPKKEAVQITHPDASKKNALLLLKKLLKWKKEEIAGIGDSANDQEFLNECGFKITVPDACEEMKRTADLIAPGSGYDSIGKVLNLLIT